MTATTKQEMAALAASGVTYTLELVRKGQVIEREVIHNLMPEQGRNHVVGVTIKGVTHAVTVPFTFGGSAVDPFGNSRIGFEGSVVVNRKDWGLTWNAALETGGVLVSDKVNIDIEISAIKVADAA